MPDVPAPSEDDPSDDPHEPQREGDRIVLTDPRALRALAHPARTAVLDELYQGKVRTSSQLAELTGLTPSAMSYHLRALEKWGIVVRAESVDGRERPWAAAAKGFSLSGRDAAQAATDTVVGLYLDRLGRDLATWRRAEPTQGEWSDTSQVSRGFPWLTADELREVNAAVMAVFEPYFVRDATNHPEGGRRVAYLFATAPLVEDAEPSGSDDGP
ncbi:ArsR/SmtB family transcription factor [Angustibacter luteus]|uniref:ArsR/SmtB family transcription factor n=1 Tax=Angustibacter luteus TaxID=658456 RepID=A0ABW1JFT0_9ACTN